MRDYFRELFSSGYLPKGACFQWNQSIVWTNAISDIFMALVHFAVPILILVFISKRKDISYSWKFLFFFSAFNFLSGVLYLIDIFITWHPVHSLDALVRLFASFTAIGTAIFLVPFISRVLKITNPEELKELNLKLEAEMEEHRKAVQINELLLVLTVGISTARNIHESFYFTLKKICDTTKWALGDAWLYNPETDRMEFANAFYDEAFKEMVSFVNISSRVTFCKGEGLPGKAWETKNSVWENDISKMHHLPRREAAEKAGIKTAVACPIPLDDEVIAVMAFYMLEEHEEDKKFVEIITAVSGQLGLILKQKRLEENQKEAHLRFHSLTESSPDAIILADKKGKIVFANKGTENLFGYSKEELIGNSLTILMPERYRKPHQDGINRYISTKQARVIGKTVALEGLKKDNTEFPMELSVGTWEGNKEIFFSGIIRDVTERKRTETELLQKNKELEQSNQELERFAFVASHDMKEPLRMVSNYTQLLSKRYTHVLDEEGREYIKYAVEGVHRIQKLINDLLTYARVGQMELDFKDTDINIILHDALTNLENAIKESKAEIIYENMPIVSGIAPQLIQLFQNLISNAIKFIPQNTRPAIKINAKKEKDLWLFSVVDNGIGIEPQYAEKIFVLFQRLHAWNMYPGTGIGLAICKKIVELHGGAIWFDSVPGEGTTFYFTLPATKE